MRVSTVSPPPDTAIQSAGANRRRETPSGPTPANATVAEAELIRRVQQNPALFGEVYRAHHPAIAGYLYRRVGDSDTAEDLAADVFLIALQYLPRYRSRGLPLLAWLYRLASNRVNRWARRERARAWRQLDECTAAACAAPAGPHADQAEQLELKLTRQTARAALLTLAPKYQTVLALHYLEGMPIDQIAAAVGCRVGTVKSRLSRGREQLRSRLVKTGSAST